MWDRRGTWRWALAAALLAGCGGPSAPAARSTGADAVVAAYGAALVRQDWDAAYAALGAESRAACGPEAFRRAARQYRNGLGFEPTAVHVRSCEEQGDEAVAHVVFIGPSGSPHRSYHDGVTLRRSDGRWGVVLPAWLRATR